MGTLRHGVHQQLEDEANMLLRADLARSISIADRADILTPSKEALRRRKEIFVASGTPDPSVRQGVYGRAANKAMPHLNSRDGNSAPSRGEQSRSSAGLSSFVEQHLA